MAPPVSASDSRHDSLAAAVIFVAALAVSLWCTRLGWHNRLGDTHEFRQTQTALSAYWMVRDGFRFDYDTPVMGAPWSIPMEFPLYQAVVAYVVRFTGVPLESAGRGVSLFFFYAALPAIWLLLRRLRIPPPQCCAFLALVLLCPIYLFYSRTFFIESTAFCLGCWFLYAFHVALQGRHWGDVFAAAVLGIIAGVTKVTSYAVFLAPAFALGLAAIAENRPRWRSLLARGCWSAVPGVLAATAWTYYADALKNKNVFGVMMTSVNQRDWNYGPLSLRFEGKFWELLFAHLRYTVAPTTALMLFAVLALLFMRRQWRVAAVLLAIALAGPVVFANLYWVHDYYEYSSAVLFLALLAFPLLQFFRASEITWLARWGTIVLVLAAEFLGYLAGYYPRQIVPATDAPTIARALHTITRPEDVILGFGMNWSSVFPYYSERRGLMVPDKYVRDEAAISKAIANVGAAKISAIVLYRLGDPKPEFFKGWLPKLGMDENPFIQTGEYTIHLRKDRMPEALKALANFEFKDALLYQGQLAPPGQAPPVIYWVDTVKDRSVFSMMSPQPLKVTVPFGLGAHDFEGRHVFNAHSTSEVEIPAPPKATHISAVFGISPGAYDKTDGVELVIVYAPPNAGPQELYRRYIRPATVKSDQGPQEISIDTSTPMNGSVLFRVLPGGGPNYDWGYWAKIEIR